MGNDRVEQVLTLLVVAIFSAWMATVSLSLENINDKLNVAKEVECRINQ